MKEEGGQDQPLNSAVSNERDDPEQPRGKRQGGDDNAMAETGCYAEPVPEVDEALVGEMISMWNKQENNEAVGRLVNILAANETSLMSESPYACEVEVSDHPVAFEDGARTGLHHGKRLCSEDEPNSCSGHAVAESGDIVNQEANLFNLYNGPSGDSFPPNMITEADFSTSCGSNPITPRNQSHYAEPRPKSKPEDYIIYKSLNYLPFTTRFHMLQKGSTMKLVDDNPRQSVVITDKHPPPYSNKQRSVLKYTQSEETSSSSSSSTKGSPEVKEPLANYNLMRNTESPGQSSPVQKLQNLVESIKSPKPVSKPQTETPNTTKPNFSFAEMPQFQYPLLHHLPVSALPEWKKMFNKTVTVESRSVLRNHTTGAPSSGKAGWIYFQSMIDQQSKSAVHNSDPGQASNVLPSIALLGSSANLMALKPRTRSRSTYQSKIERMKLPIGSLATQPTPISNLIYPEIITGTGPRKRPSASCSKPPGESSVSAAKSPKFQQTMMIQNSPLVNVTSPALSQPEKKVCVVELAKPPCKIKPRSPGFNCQILSSAVQREGQNSQEANSDHSIDVLKIDESGGVEFKKEEAAETLVAMARSKSRDGNNNVNGKNHSTRIAKPREERNVSDTLNKSNGSLNSSGFTNSPVFLPEASSSPSPHKVYKIKIRANSGTPALKGTLPQGGTVQIEKIPTPANYDTNEILIVKPESSSGQKFMSFEDFLKETHKSDQDLMGNSIHKCTKCKKIYTIYDAFVAHARTHYTRYHKTCMVCGKTFSRSWLLKGHMRTHTGEKPYKCEYVGCGKAFADRSNLRSHMNIHAAKSFGRTHVCEKCQRTFAQKRYLNKHVCCDSHREVDKSAIQNFDVVESIATEFVKPESK